jgi:predicted phosphodiesterase
MRIAVLSDIHANWDALLVFEQHLKDKKIDQVWFLGDAIGYGAYPVEVLGWVLKNVPGNRMVFGNHDAMFLGLFSAQHSLLKRFSNENILHLTYEENQIPYKLNGLNAHDWNRTNSDAITVVLNNFEKIKKIGLLGERLYLKTYRKLNQKFHLNGRNQVLIHGSLDHSRTNFEYIFPNVHPDMLIREMQACESMIVEPKNKSICWYGHTHFPMLLSSDSINQVVSPVYIEFGKKYQLNKNYYMINPGSLGFARDGCSGGSYVIYDTEPGNHSLEFQRIEYNKPAVKRKMLQENVPKSVIRKFMTAQIPSGSDKISSDMRMHFKGLCSKEGQDVF